FARWTCPPPEGPKGHPAVLSSPLPLFRAPACAPLACVLDRRSGRRLRLLLVGILFATGRRTVTSWCRAAGITADFRPAYHTVCASGQRADHLAASAFYAVRPLLGSGRLTVALDDTPTPRYGPQVEGCGIHHNPTPGPAGEQFLYGHLWVTVAALTKHPDRGTGALPLLARPSIRRADLAKLPPDRRRPFQTKLELAAGQLRWLRPWVAHGFTERWVVIDGGYAKRPFLRPALPDGWVVVGRLRQDAALWSLPEPKP